MPLRHLRPLLAVAGAALVLGACERPTAPAAPAAPSARPRAQSGESTGRSWSLLACATTRGASARAVVGPAGGTLEAGGYRIDVPAGAVPTPQTFSLVVVPGPHPRIEALAEGHQHFTFAAPVSVTMDLAACTVLPAGLHAFYVDDAGTLLEDMGGVVDQQRRQLRFKTPHFSGYTIAWRTGGESDSLSQP